MPSLDRKSKGRCSYFSSDDNNYLDIFFIHYWFLTKKSAESDN